MQLNEWFGLKKMTQVEMSERSGISKWRLCRIACGHEDPELREVIIIDEITRGKVRAKDWLDRVKQKMNGSKLCG